VVGRGSLLADRVISNCRRGATARCGRGRLRRLARRRGCDSAPWSPGPVQYCRDKSFSDLPGGGGGDGICATPLPQSSTD